MARPRKSKRSRKVVKLEQATGTRKALLYTRVSSPEQEREGFSLDAQENLLRDYAVRNGYHIVSRHIDVETAKSTGRTEFAAMLKYFKDHRSVRILLVEKVDRLYRNMTDYLEIENLDIEIHLVKEGVVISKDSKSSEKFIHGIKVLMAKNYVDNLSEETKKGLLEKASQGIWPTHAPTGYINVLGSAGKRIIIPDPEAAPLVIKLFEWMETGEYSLAEVTEKIRDAGLRSKLTKQIVGRSSIHHMLRNPIYIGRIEWRGESFRGVHQPLVSSLTWNNVQELLDRRSVKNTHGDQLRFAFTGLITCGHCGCAVVAQMQKKRYVYYHCSGFRQKCPEKYVREEALTEAIAQQLARLQVDDEIFSLIERAIVDAQCDEDKERNEEMVRLKAEADRLQVRMDKLYVDRLEGRIPVDMYDRLASEWQDERMQSLERLEGFREVDDALIGDGIELLDLARKAHRTFVLQSPSDKISVLKLLLSNCTWANGELTVEFREPFAMLEKISPEGPAFSAPGGGSEAECPNWLPE